MNEQTKSAYRHLLYVAMLRMRQVGQPWGKFSKNPLAWYHTYRQSRQIGMEADWLHNLAYFSARGFEQFDESRFWADHASLCGRYPDGNLERYKDLFALHLSGEILVC